MTEHAAPADHATMYPLSFTVFPLRFTADPVAMIAFLRTLGMAPVITAGDDAFGDLSAGAGRVMIHSVRGAVSGAAAGDTDLCLAVRDAEAAAATLDEAGLTVSVWDESYGKQGRIGGPVGEGVSLNEDQVDLYGFHGHDASVADPGLSVMAVLSSDDFARDTEHFAGLGFDPVGPGGQGWRELRGPSGAGSIGLHQPAQGDRRTRPTGDEFGDCLQVKIGFSTTEGLGSLAARLTGAGYPARAIEGEGVRSVHVTDPDGQHVEIHPRS